MSSRLADLVNGFADRMVVVIGDLMLDRSVFGTAERISPEAPVPVLKVQRTNATLGGAGNVARNVVRLGGRATLIGVIGSDAAGREFSALAAAEPRLTLAPVVEPGRCTTVKTRYIAQGQQLLRADTEQDEPVSAQAAAEMRKQLRRALVGASALVLSDYAKGVLGRQLAADAILLAREAGVIVLVDPKTGPLERFRGADVVTPNVAEARLATGHEVRCETEASAAARAIATTSGCPAVVLTRGAAGMTVLMPDGQILHLPTEARDVFDVSGAGDTVVAVLALALGGDANLIDGARLANVAAGIAVGKLGTAAVEADELGRAMRRLGLSSQDAKVVGVSEAASRAEEWRGRGLRVVFTNGCFDLIHPGHLHLLRHARSSGDRLIVGLNTDASVRRLKGDGRPLQGEDARAQVLASFDMVDLVLPFADDTPLHAIERIRPDVLVKGADYALDAIVGADVVRRSDGRVVVVPLLDGYSTTSIARRAAAGPS